MQVDWSMDIVFSLFREYFTQIYTSPLHVKGCKLFCLYSALRPLYREESLSYHITSVYNERLDLTTSQGSLDLFKPGSPRGGSDVHVELILINAYILEYIYRKAPRT